MSLQTIKYNNKEYVFQIGKNAENNWNIIKIAESDDIWFHVNDYSSAHVILKNPDLLSIKDFPIHVLRYCAIKCKNKNNKLKHINNLSVCYTKINNIKLGTNVGSVIIGNDKVYNINV